MKMLKHLTANEVKLEEFPFKRELSMEAYLAENEDILSLDDDAFSDVSVIEEQITLKEIKPRKVGGDGRIDMLVTYSPEHIGIVEIKLDILKEGHLKQLEDYLKNGKEQILRDYDSIISKDVESKWIGVLVGKSIDTKLADKISSGYAVDKKIPIAALVVRRFKGDDGNIYVATETYFKNSLSKDYSKYKFNGEEFGKGKLVLAVVKQYVETKPSVSFSELERVFPKEIQGSQGVFVTQEKAEEVFSKEGIKPIKRHFLNADQRIALSNAIIAVSNQWGKRNIKKFIKRAKELGYEIEKSKD